MKIIVSYIIYVASLVMFINRVELEGTDWLLFASMIFSLGFYGLWAGEKDKEPKKKPFN